MRVQSRTRAHASAPGTAAAPCADALVIEAQAKRRLADEYDAAQANDEVARCGANRHTHQELPRAKSLNLSHPRMHEYRELRDAEVADPGIVRRVVDEAVANREEPTKAMGM